MPREEFWRAAASRDAPVRWRGLKTTASARHGSEQRSGGECVAASRVATASACRRADGDGKRAVVSRDTVVRWRGMETTASAR
jgi:hypothetical protein